MVCSSQTQLCPFLCGDPGSPTLHTGCLTLHPRCPMSHSGWTLGRGVCHHQADVACRSVDYVIFRPMSHAGPWTTSSSGQCHMLAQGLRQPQANVTCWPMDYLNLRPMSHAGPWTTSTSGQCHMLAHGLCHSQADGKCRSMNLVYMGSLHGVSIEVRRLYVTQACSVSASPLPGPRASLHGRPAPQRAQSTSVVACDFAQVEIHRCSCILCIGMSCMQSLLLCMFAYGSRAVA